MAPNQPPSGDGPDAASDWSWASRQARLEADEAELWESRRAGRPVGVWAAEVEVRAAAADEEEARWRLAGYTRQVLYRTLDSGLLSSLVPLGPGDCPGDVEVVDHVEAGEQNRLEAWYPWHSEVAFDRDPYGPGAQAEVDSYVSALRAAARHLLGEPGVNPDPTVPSAPASQDPPTHGLRTWRAVHEAIFLASDSDAARARAAELASMIVDPNGSSAGRLLNVRPHDEVFPEAASWELMDSLWDDYDSAEGTVGEPVVLAALLNEAAGRLERQYDHAVTDIAFENLVRHRQPDGSITVSTVEQLATAAAWAVDDCAGRTASELEELAARADFLANRVYGKHVETDDEVRRIEMLRRQAQMYRTAAGR